MTHEQILTKAIQRAIAGGWGPWNAPIIVKQFGEDLYLYIADERWNIEAIIYDKDFARALWGTSRQDCAYCGQVPVHLNHCPYYGILTPPLWEYHLQQMVITDDPIKYLGSTL